MYKIGMGYDVHRLVDGRDLILGGVHVPFEKGLLGHSDADVLVHSIMDALLGAIGAGDIGKHFPDTDPAYKGASSIDLLRTVYEKVRAEGYVLGNLDCTIVAQQPKLRPYIDLMVQMIASTLLVSEHLVNVKATTEEELGFTGRMEGISAKAVCLIRKE